MSDSLSVLLVEDSATDAELLIRELRRAGFELNWTRVETEPAFLAALESSPDLILSDYSLPRFDGLQALALLRNSGREIPFILISGTVGEEVAVKAMQMGATDYLLKDRLGRLGAAVARALESTQLRLERRQMEARLIASERRYRRLFEAAKDGILILNAATGMVDDVNPFLTELLGYSKEQFLLKKVWELGFLQHFIANEEKFHELQQNDYVRYDGLPLETADGRRIDVEFVSNAYEVDHVRVIQCNIRDITARTRAEAESKRQHIELQHILDTVPALIYYKDREGRFLRANQELATLVGVPLDAFIGKTDADMGSPHGEHYRKDDLHVMTTGVPIHHREETLYTAIGTRHLLTDKVPLRNESGEIIGILGLSVDITARKSMETLLRIQDRAIQAASEGIIIADASQVDCPVIYANQGFESITGYSVAEAIGRNCRFLQGKDTDPAAISTIRNAILGEQPVTVELLNYRKDGKAFWNKMSITPVRDESGKLTHFVGIQSDVTERRSTEEQLRQSQKMEAVGQLAGGVAHDFNNLLTVIDGYTGLLLTAQVSADTSREYLKEIQSASDRAADLTGRLLAFSRREVRTPETLDLNAVVTETIKMLGRLLGEDIALELTLAPELNRVWADRSQISQILMNLALNARDSMLGNGRISVCTENLKLAEPKPVLGSRIEPGDYVVLSVADTGCGMPANILARIFEPFFTTKPLGKGTGLGLAIVHGIVVQNEGSIEVTSQVGNGTTFRVYLPALALQHEFRLASSDSPSAMSGTETVLLVEDDYALRRMTQVMLTSYGYRVLQAANGREALQLFTLHAPTIQLLISDIVMPGLSGQDLAAQLLALKPELRVLFMSGYVADEEERELFLKPEVRFLQKPFSVEGLALKVREVLDAR